ncbi:MAG: hypothetical protein IIV60_06440 [Alistipes sp.]|nr:hypothetical protein [Alistipes sp.]
MKEFWLKIKDGLMQAIEPKDIRIFVKLLMIWLIAFLYLVLFAYLVRVIFGIIMILSQSGLIEDLANMLKL